MSIYEIIFNAVFNLLGVYVGIRIIKLFLPERITNPAITLPVYAAVWLVNWLLYFFFDVENLTTFSMFIGLFVAACFIFQGKITQKLLAVIISLSSGIVAENLVWIIYERHLLPFHSETTYGFLSVILEFLAILLIERLVHLDRYARLPLASYLHLIFLSIGSVVLSELVMLSNCSENLIMFGLTLLCLIVASTYYIYEKTAESYRKEIEQTTMQQQVEMYAKQFEIINTSQENLKSLRHDMKNHLSLISAYLSNNDYEKAANYTQQFLEQLNTSSEYSRTGNIEIDSILNYKLEHIQKDLNCEPQLSISVPRQSFMPDFDLNILLGNLLDNAADALKQTKEKRLNVELKYTKSTFYISVHNSFSGQLKQKNQRFLSSKKDSQAHGIGLSNVERIVQKYHGTIHYDHQDNIFGVDIILYPSLEKAD